MAIALKLLREDEVPVRPFDLVFRGARFGRIVACIIFCTLCAGLLAVGAVMPRISLYWDGVQYVLYPLGIVMLLPAWACWRTMKAMFWPTNWLLRAGLEGLYLRYRSPLNGDYPGDPVAVLVPRPLIRRLGKTVERRRQTDDEGVRWWTNIGCLDIHVRPGELEPLKAALKHERQRRLPTRHGSRTTFLHFPVRVIDDATIRIEWRSSNFATSPRLDRALAILGRHYLTAGAAPGPVSRLPEDDLLTLAEAGDMIEAMKLAKSLYGFNTTDAKVFVDGLIR